MKLSLVSVGLQCISVCVPRSADTGARTLHSGPQLSLMSKDETRELMALWPDILRDLTDGRHFDPINDKWITKVLQYNVPTGKKIRALALIYTYKILVPQDRATEENLRLARILSWCIEILQAYLLMCDDIQDRSEIRRGQLCWYLVNDRGLPAISDCLMVEMCVYKLLKIHLKSHECYGVLQDLFLDTTYKTVMGQILDMYATVRKPGEQIDFSRFTMDRMNNIMKHKTAYYTFVLPVQAAMHFVGIKDPELFRQAQTILIEMGQYFQVRDDYLDCYGDKEVTGKNSTDIAQGKCTWLIVVALQRATQKQRKILEECYGIADEEKVNRVMQVYDEIGLQNTFSIYDQETYNLLHTHIQQISRGLPHDIFLQLLKLVSKKQMER
ncbi:farnesyl pyrophosphate synthase isoform X3 [Nomia melanderi]|uniref:farnesyl pyrophosphate synthase isoform X3 n=1 Tax=Nomia melanderi TaxID=2448451 RepID=UPI001304157D|nr:farnesyl pyrophosphate synthase isoform X3 [Nomia melanderi]